MRESHNGARMHTEHVCYFVNIKNVSHHERACSFLITSKLYMNLLPFVNNDYE